MNRSLLVLLVAAVVMTLMAPPSQAAGRERVRPDFFGMDISIGTTGAATWPSFAPGAVRISTPWSQVERSRGSYDWAHTDVKVETSEQHGAKPLLVIESTPKFRALDAANATYASPPRLGAYRKFVKKLSKRYGARVDYQVWNEPNVPLFYTGTPAHMARMTKVAGRTIRKFAPGATVVAPSFPIRGEVDGSFRVWFREYWSQRIGKQSVARFVDAANISAYPMPEDGPEQAIDLVRWARRTVAKTSGFRGPLFASEINYGANGLAATKQIRPRRQAAYVIRTYALNAAIGADRVYWWRWEGHQTVNTQLQDGKGNLTRAGRAYGVVKDWLVGTKPKGCSIRKGVRTCHFRARGGVHRYVVWSRSGKSRTVRGPEGTYTRTGLSGNAKTIEPGRRFRIGMIPVMIETDARWSPHRRTRVR